MSNEFWAAITGAIVGSVIGGLVSFILQSISLREAREQRELEVSEKKKALGYSLVLKMSKIYLHLSIFRDHLEEFFKKIQNNGKEPWQVVKPFAGLPDKVYFSSDELALVFSLNENDLFNKLFCLDDIYNKLIDVFAIYGKDRIELTSMLPAEVKGLDCETELDQEQMRILEPKMAGLNQLAVDMQDSCRRNYSDAETILPQLSKVLNEKIGLELNLEVVPEKRTGC